MKMSLRLLFLLLVTGLQACNTKMDCEDYLCTSPPPTLFFELVDKGTGEDLFGNGTFNPGELEIINLTDNSKVDFGYRRDMGAYIIQVQAIGWETEKNNYLFEIGGEPVFNLYMDVERLTEDCCTFTRVHEISIEDQEFEYDPETRIYKVLVD